MDISNLLTHNEFAEKVKMSPELFRYYINTDRGPEPIKFKDRVYYNKNDAETWDPEKKPAGRKPK